MTTPLNIRIDAESKAQAKAILDSLGIPMSRAVEMFFKQIVFHHGIPFDVKVPNKTTLAALDAVEEGREVHTAANAKEFLQELHS